MDFSPHIDATISEADFLTNLSVEIPARRYDVGRDELGADVAFAEGFFVHPGDGEWIFLIQAGTKAYGKPTSAAGLK